MSEWNLYAPVALFVFNRPDETKCILEKVAAVEPETLLVIADGPRDGHPQDPDRCAEVRSVVDERVDWGCDLKRNYADQNLGLKDRFATGLRWIFQEEREAIILEDDCLPSESFFRFCDEMLEEYREDKRVMDISGSNHLGEYKSDRQDYHFSFYGGIWGWATWRRAWEWYDPEMELWENDKVRARFRDVIADREQADYLEYIYGKAHDGDLITWDYQWGFARHINWALSVVPSRNLVSNIGFGDAATNTTSEESEWANIQRHEMEFPIEHPECVAIDREYDRRFHEMRPISERNRFLRWGKKLYEGLDD